MISGMTHKIAVSLPDEQVEAARRAVAQGRAPSVSAYVSAALAQHQERESLRQLLDDLDRDHGPVPPELVEWARTVAEGVGTATRTARWEPPEGGAR